MLTDGPDPTSIQFSLFTTPVSRGPHRAETWTLADLHNAISAGHWWDVITPIRELAPHKREKDKSGKRKSTLAQQYSDLKDQTLPYAVFSGTWDPRHRHADGFNCKAKECPGNGLLQPSGLRLLDLDDLHDGEAAWIFAAVDDGTLPWAAAAWTSTGGDGIHIVAWLDPAPTDQATSHAAPTPPWPAISPPTSPASKSPTTPAAKTSCAPPSYPPTATPASARTPRLSCGRTSRSPKSSLGLTRSQPRHVRTPIARGCAKPLDAMAQHQIGGQHDESDFLSVMANMKCYGFSFHAFDQWAADAGCTCEREPRWNQPPASNQSDRPGWAIINLAAKRYGYEKPRPDQPIPEAEPGANPQIVPNRWFEIGQWIAERILIPDFAYVPQENHEPAWWQWIDGCRWSLLSTNSHTIADRLHARQFTLAARLKADGNEEAAHMVGNHRT